MRVRRAWPVAALLLAPVLAGCGDDEPSAEQTPSESGSPSPSVTPTPSPSETSEAPSEPPSSAAPALPTACELVTADTLAKALGVSFAAGEPGGGSTEENGIAWKSDNCSFEAEDLMEVKVKITGPDDFTTGTFSCPQPTEVAAILEPADDVAGATEGWWKVSDSPPLEATLRACSPTVNVDVDFEYEDGVDYEGDPRQQAAQIAEFVLAALAGD
ncbi:hypothetical protein ASE01_15805 [Nocardioides sp. Root190]|uniref:hypothetical protein n=1 Tax=Nocardioides sp. Root190 TaxID=1736488 RepID=UPI0006F3717A|nr:hypothetical protein [Nocardioides sp. Root190]KRB76428.1 hypothetical protein ASE01_15805 [Nocardioides sp. Root190]